MSQVLLEKSSFEPMTFHQYVNLSLNFESIYLFSPSKVLLLSRKIQIGRENEVPFQYTFVVDFLDPLGLIRRSQLLDEFCAVEDEN